MTQIHFPSNILVTDLLVKNKILFHHASYNPIFLKIFKLNLHNSETDFIDKNLQKIF